MKKIHILLMLLIGLTNVVNAQSDRPKLVVGVVIDQMRWDYLYRFQSLYGEDGFARLLREGYSCENTFIPYMPTYTAPGHTCIYTGSVPAIHGIIGNNWFDRNLNKTIYCTDDTTVNTIGNEGKAGKMSPQNMWATTITDELRLSNNFKSKVIGVALKDRGAILPAGHSANAAYWYDAGKWITSSFYMDELPGWVNMFNQKDEVSHWMSKDWDTFLPSTSYGLSTPDDVPYEGSIKGEKKVTFPHKLSAIDKSQQYEAFRTTPYANTFTFEFAKAAIDNEKLGKNTVTDFLTVSISSTDYIGHAFGPNSVETEDTYLRLDRDIAEFLKFLDITVGKGKYTLFLTADHGVAHIPQFLNDHKIPAGSFDDADLEKDLNIHLEKIFSRKGLVKKVMNYQIYLNEDLLKDSSVRRSDLIASAIDILKHKEYIAAAFETEAVSSATLPETQKMMVVNGYNQKRSGNIQFILRPGYFDGGFKGTTHGLWNPYDSHIPFILYGWGIKPGRLYRNVYMTDIAPTIAALLRIQMPNGCIGKVVEEALK